MNYRWACGVTTVPERRTTLLPHTLTRLRAGGFKEPWLFVDGDWDRSKWVYPGENLVGGITVRFPKVRTYANWLLGLMELYLRTPEADMFAMFQDDLTMCCNVRQYIERGGWPDDAYLNLFTFPSNQSRAPRRSGWYASSLLNDDMEIKHRAGLNDGTIKRGNTPEWQQTGRGAVALVFPRKVVMTLLTATHMIDRVHDVHRGWRCLDGGIVTAMNQCGITEYVHNPSLVQHTGIVSTINPNGASNGFEETFAPRKWPADVCVGKFPGEVFDALSWLGPAESDLAPRG